MVPLLKESTITFSDHSAPRFKQVDLSKIQFFEQFTISGVIAQARKHWVLIYPDNLLVMRPQRRIEPLERLFSLSHRMMQKLTNLDRLRIRLNSGSPPSLTGILRFEPYALYQVEVTRVGAETVVVRLNFNENDTFIFLFVSLLQPLKSLIAIVETRKDDCERS